MHYTAGFGAFTSMTMSDRLPPEGLLWTAARLLLDGAGALFAIYLLVFFSLVVSGAVLRTSDRAFEQRTVIRLHAHRGPRGHVCRSDAPALTA